MTQLYRQNPPPPTDEENAVYERIMRHQLGKRGWNIEEIKHAIGNVYTGEHYGIQSYGLYIEGELESEHATYTAAECAAHAIGLPGASKPF